MIIKIKSHIQKKQSPRSPSTSIRIREKARPMSLLQYATPAISCSKMALNIYRGTKRTLVTLKRVCVMFVGKSLQVKTACSSTRETLGMISKSSRSNTSQKIRRGPRCQIRKTSAKKNENMFQR